MDGAAPAALRPRGARAALLAAIVVTGAGGCSSGPAGPGSGTALHAAAQPGPPGSPGAAARGAGVASEAEGARVRVPLSAPVIEPLEVAIEASLDGRAALFVSQRSSDRIGWVRVLDGATGARGPALRLDGEHLYGALTLPGGGTRLLTSRDGELCLLTFRRGEAAPSSRACGGSSARALAAVGDRIALLEIEEIARPAGAVAKGKAPAAAAAGGKAGAKASGASKPKPKGRKSEGAKGGASKPRRGGAAKRTAEGARKAAKPGKASGRTQARAARPAPRPQVEVKIRWVSADGVFDEVAAPTGLRFRPPLEGMSLIDAVGRPGAIDVLHYDEAPKRKSASPLGAARVLGSFLDGDGVFDPTRRALVVEGDLEYGHLRGHEQPRLLGTAEGSVYLGAASRGGPCEAARFSPTFERFTGAPCEVGAGRLTLPAPFGKDELDALERIRAADPRRTPLQPAHDGPLVVWAGERAYYQVRGELFSAGREDGLPRREEAPIAARRARIAWGTIAADGEGIAWAGGRLRRLNTEGRVEGAVTGAVTGAGTVAGTVTGAETVTETDTETVTETFTETVTETVTGAGAAAAMPVVPGEPGSAMDRRRAARIGASWWLARGSVIRLIPSPVAPPDLRGRAHPDGTVLVGGPERGIFLEVAAGRLRATAIDPEGSLAPLGAPAPSPVRAGFDACERRAGGAILAGVSAADPRKVVALAIDAAGRPGPAHATSLPIIEGAFAVRVVPLPGGGALLHDLDRRHVVWLSDDGAELASRPWPAAHSGAACVDGRPAPREVPAPTPGAFLQLPELAAPGACVLGDIVWAADGSLRWFGSTSNGLDAQAEAGIIRPASAPVTAPAPAPVPVPVPVTAPASVPVTAPVTAPASDPCPSDMVAITRGDLFCVDRFESALVDAETGEPLSPDYPPTPNLLEFTLAEWATGRQRIGDIHARAMPLPFLPAWQRGKKIASAARARSGARPSGYVSGLVAEAACAAAGKRLCTIDEFVTACRGEDDTLFPYGDAYEDGACNVFRDAHPAAILHGNASMGHLDPRLNRVRWKGEPLLREAGATPRCRSRWGADAVYDLVGNLDEWVDEPGGAFAGGFYSRSTRSGCEALVTAHPRTYADYSTGLRCCLGGPAAPQGGGSR